MKEFEQDSEFDLKLEELKKRTLTGTREECGINKLIAKVPFQAAVIDDEHRVFTYMFIDGVVNYIFLYSVTPE